MSSIYPIICQFDQDLEDLRPFITELFLIGESCQFNPISHLHVKCNSSKHDMKMGKSKGFTIIYIADSLKRKALEIIAQLNKDYPEDLDEECSDQEQNDMTLAQRIPQCIFKCPACLLEFNCE